MTPRSQTFVICLSTSTGIFKVSNNLWFYVQTLMETIGIKFIKIRTSTWAVTN